MCLKLSTNRLADFFHYIQIAGLIVTRLGQKMEFVTKKMDIANVVMVSTVKHVSKVKIA